jgi:hypothetical protein
MTEHSREQSDRIVDRSATDGAPVVWKVGPGLRVDPLDLRPLEAVLGRPGAGKGSGGAA